MISKIRENLFIGKYSDVVAQFEKTADENRQLLVGLKSLGITDVLSLCNSNEENCLNKKEKKSFETNRAVGIKFHHQSVPSNNGNYVESFKLALKKLDRILAVNPKAKVLIHCFGGIDRAPFLAASFLSFSDEMDLACAYSELRKVRPFVVSHYEWKWWTDL